MRLPSAPAMDDPTAKKLWVPYATALGLCLVVIALWWALENREQQTRLQAVQTEAATILNLMDMDLHNRLRSLQRFVSRWQQGDGMTRDEFTFDAGSYLADHPGYQALEWVDPAFTVRWVIPEQGNEQAIGLNLSLESKRRAALMVAHQQRAAMMTAPLQLVQNGTGFLVYVPIYVGERFDGFLLAVFRTQSWIEFLLNNRNAAEQFQSRVQMDQQDIYQRADGDELRTTLQSQASQMIFGHRFTVYTRPTRTFIERTHTPLPELVLLLGISLSACLVVIIFLYQKASTAIATITENKQTLEEQIRQRQLVEVDREMLINDIGERVKALHCLYSLSRLAESTGKDLDHFLNEVAECLPPAWQHAEYATACIEFDGSRYVTTDFQDSTWKQEAGIQINGTRRGAVQVFYTDPFPEEEEGPFTLDERYLINEVADRISTIIQQKKAAEALARERQRLAFILDGTHVGTWEWNIQSGETVFNSRWAEHLGYQLEELTPVSVKTWERLTHPEDLKKAYRLLQKHFSGKSQYYECELRLKHKQGHWVWLLDRGKVSVWTAQGEPLMMFGTHMDITEKKESEARIRHLANHDTLTGLPSLRLARDRISMALEHAHRKHTQFAVMFFDLDGFKQINDRYGHDAGDFVLKTVASHLLQCVRKSDTVARIGGDEFILLLAELKNAAAAEEVAQKVIATIQQPIHFDDQLLQVQASIGIALYPDHGHTSKALIKQADTAMYVVKNRGKNGFLFASPAQKTPPPNENF